jgi:hypothetical protein
MELAAKILESGMEIVYGEFGYIIKQRKKKK